MKRGHVLALAQIAQTLAGAIVRVAAGVSASVLAAFALDVAGVRALAHACLLRLGARSLPFAEQDHAR